MPKYERLSTNIAKSTAAKKAIATALLNIFFCSSNMLTPLELLNRYHHDPESYQSNLQSTSELQIEAMIWLTCDNNEIFPLCLTNFRTKNIIKKRCCSITVPALPAEVSTDVPNRSGSEKRTGVGEQTGCYPIPRESTLPTPWKSADEYYSDFSE